MPLQYNRNFFKWLWLYNLEKDSIPVALTCFDITDRPSLSVPHIVIIKPHFGQTLSSFIFLSKKLNIARKHGFADWLNFKFWTAISVWLLSTTKQLSFAFLGYWLSNSQWNSTLLPGSFVCILLYLIHTSKWLIKSRY